MSSKHLKSINQCLMRPMFRITGLDLFRERATEIRTLILYSREFYDSFQWFIELIFLRSTTFCYSLVNNFILIKINEYCQVFLTFPDNTFLCVGMLHSYGILEGYLNGTNIQYAIIYLFKMCRICHRCFTWLLRWFEPFFIN